MLLTVAQSSTLDMKAIPEIVGAKEVRLCTEGDSLLGSAKGCITPLSLTYDKGKKVQWLVDDALLAAGQCWRLGTSDESAQPGTVVDIPVAKLEKLLGATGHWASKKIIDCRRWAAAEAAPADQPELAAEERLRSEDTDDRGKLYVYDPTCVAGEDYSTWYQPPYKTVFGWTL